MRLVYVCSDFGVPPDGTKGASIHLRAITRGLAELGHEVLLLSPKAGPEADHPAQRLLDIGGEAGVQVVFEAEVEEHARDHVPVVAPEFLGILNDRSEDQLGFGHILS